MSIVSVKVPKCDVCGVVFTHLHGVDDAEVEKNIKKAKWKTIDDEMNAVVTDKCPICKLKLKKSKVPNV